MMLFTETCELEFKGAPTGDYDDYGNPTYFPNNLAAQACWYEPRGSNEDTSEKDQQIFGYWLYLPLDAPLAAADSVKLMGISYQVIGEPGIQPGGFITPGFIKVALEKVTG